MTTHEKARPAHQDTDSTTHRGRAGPEWVLVLDSQQEGIRLDRFLADRCALGRRKVRRILEAGLVRLEGAPPKPGTKLDANARLHLAFDPDRIAEQGPLPDPSLDVSIIDKTPSLLVLDKPGGMPSVALSPFETGSLANFLAMVHPECLDASIDAGGDPLEAGLVHRLDSDASGLILAARNADAFRALRNLSAEGKLFKRYLALVAGRLTGRGTIDQAMVTLRHRPRTMGAAQRYPDKPALEALSSYEAIESRDDMSLLHVTIARGRPHQVRFHLANLGHPILVDSLYGGMQAPQATRPLALRCLAIQSEDKTIDFSIQPPGDWLALFG